MSHPTHRHPRLNLPDDLWRLLFSFIKAPHLMRSAALVCREWHRLVWESLCLAGFQISTPRLEAALSRLEITGLTHRLQHLKLVNWNQDDWVDFGFLSSSCPSLRSLNVKLGQSWYV